MCNVALGHYIWTFDKEIAWLLQYEQLNIFLTQDWIKCWITIFKEGNYTPLFL